MLKYVNAVLKRCIKYNRIPQKPFDSPNNSKKNVFVYKIIAIKSSSFKLNEKPILRFGYHFQSHNDFIFPVNRSEIKILQDMKQEDFSFN